jgi:hypothetical protein
VWRPGSAGGRRGICASPDVERHSPAALVLVLVRTGERADGWISLQRSKHLLLQDSRVEFMTGDGRLDRQMTVIQRAAPRVWGV